MVSFSAGWGTSNLATWLSARGECGSRAQEMRRGRRGIRLNYWRWFWKSFWNPSSKTSFWLLQFYWHFENLFQNLFEKDFPLKQWWKLAHGLSAISISIRFSKWVSIIQLNCTRPNMILKIILKMILKLNNSIEFLSRSSSSFNKHHLKWGLIIAGAFPECSAFSLARSRCNLDDDAVNNSARLGVKLIAFSETEIEEV